jgi:hypothetical protein
MLRWFTRLGYAWRRHGLTGFAWLIGHNIRYYVSRWYQSAKTSPQTDPFDEKYGTETRGLRDIHSLDVIVLPTARYAERYEPSSAELVRSQLEKLQIDYKRFTFIDFGSGKGRVLLVAAGFPFKEVVGIEFSRELHEIALQNIARIPPALTRSDIIRSIHSDVTALEPPKSDLVCYFYNPFGPPVMAAVAARLAAHHTNYGYRSILSMSILVIVRHLSRRSSLWCSMKVRQFLF